MAIYNKKSVNNLFVLQALSVFGTILYEVSFLTQLDTLFFEQYKQLDTVLCDMLKTDKGVSEYIAAMENVPEHDRKNVAGFDADYRTLKRLRWVRNQIAHDVNSALDGFCRPEDLTNLKGMYQRVMNQSDALAVLYRIKSEKKGKQRKAKSTNGTQCIPENAEDNGLFKNPFVAIAVFAAIILLALLIAKMG